MTQESPVRLCYECRSPLGADPSKVRGEYYCDDCLPGAVRRLTAE